MTRYVGVVSLMVRQKSNDAVPDAYEMDLVLNGVAIPTGITGASPAAVVQLLANRLQLIHLLQVEWLPYYEPT